METHRARGWVERRDNGKWKGVVVLPNGRRVSQTHRIKANAQKWMRDRIGEIERGSFVDPRAGNIIFRDWVTLWLPGQAALRPGTRVRDLAYLDARILPVFGDRRLSDIRQPDVQAWVAELIATGLASTTIVKAYQIVSKIMRAAVEADLIAKTPCVNVTLPRIEHQEMRVLTPDQIADLAEAVEDRYRALIFLLGYGGLRIGEACGLRLRRLDCLHGYVDVMEGLIEIKGFAEVGGLKTRAAQRRVPLPRSVVRELELHMDIFCGPDPDSFVFTSPKGNLLRPSLFRSRNFKPALKRAGLDPVRIHDMRHSAIAIWIAAGVNVKEIAVRAGHRSVSTVLDRYGHLFPSADAEFAQRVDGLFVPAASKTNAR